MFKFEVVHICKQSGARVCRITTNTNSFLTPVFMPVGTNATVKGLSSEEVYNLSSGIILANTYHLMISPGADIIKLHGGCKKMMRWENSLLTDSGGFQVFSLAKKNDITDAGVKFTNFKNGDKYFLTPEKSIKIQNEIGADIIMAFDECVSLPAEDKYLKSSIKRTSIWAKRCLDEHKRLNSNQAIFGIFQGGLNKDLRLESLKEIGSMEFDGIAIGGLSVGETSLEMHEMLKFLKPHLPKDKPHYLMGVGTPYDFIMSVLEGVDMMDCVLPTRNARHGQIFTTGGKINIKNEKFKSDITKIDPKLNSYASNFTYSYLRHLFKSDEALGQRIATIQNLAYMKWLTSECQKAIMEDRYLDFVKEITKIYNK